MALKQLNVRLPEAVVKALKAEAASAGVTLNTLVQQRLTGELAAAAKPLAADVADQLAAADRELANQIAALERRLAALEPGETPVRPVEAVPLRAALPEGVLTTPALAAATGTSRSAWNNWCKGREPGAIRRHPQAGAWELVGWQPGASGGPPQRTWRRAS